MPIYTKTGDKGTTAIFGGGRVSKAHPQVNSYGTIDELTSFIGLVAALVEEVEEREFLTTVQGDLYKMMGIMAGANTPITALDRQIDEFERRIDALDRTLPKLTRFILPGGSVLAGWFHVLRATCRRAEREVVAFFTSDIPHTINDDSQRIMMKYLNRLSDLFFMMARKHSGGNEAVT
ncbi:MAG: cob(I)yrinic acid a,c-diamide adenosyltransferase [Patescibacteria group bacterium]|nr:cob(I)yrinic acid a,c-diamide adenosyltransferase [Patescibacteria group bacterium]